MRRHIRVINFITVAGGVVLILKSPWPGQIGGCLGCLALPAVALLGLAWLNVFAIWLLGAGEGRKALKLRQLAFAPAVVCLTLLALHYYIPCRIAFALCRSRFDGLVKSVPSNDSDGVAFGRWVGIYYVDRYANDPGSGTFFRTGLEGGNLDKTSYGFAYQPNLDSRYTPFGHSYYDLCPLGGGWYWVTVTDRF
jgi:hypothetical protein